MEKNSKIMSKIQEHINKLKDSRKFKTTRRFSEIDRHIENIRHCEKFELLDTYEFVDVRDNITLITCRRCHHENVVIPIKKNPQSTCRKCDTNLFTS